MRKLGHYFHPFQAFLVEQAEDDNGRFDMQVAFALLRADAKYRCTDISPAAMFFFQFEILCRNRLDYDYGLQAMAGDPAYSDDWPRWILDVRHKIGIIELADLIYVHSEHYLERTEISDESEKPDPILFGDSEGRIALANRKKEPPLFVCRSPASIRLSRDAKSSAGRPYPRTRSQAEPGSSTP